MADLDVTQQAALKVELTVNPKGLLYAGKTSTEIATLLNTVGLSNERQTGAGVIASQVLLSCIVYSEYIAMSTVLQQRLSFWLSTGSLDTSNTDVRLAMSTILSGSPQTLAKMQAAVDRPITRGESLFGAGSVINFWDVDRAKALP